MLIETLAEQVFEGLFYIGISCGTRLEIAVAPLLRPLLGVFHLHFAAFRVALIAANDDFDSVHFDAATLHFFFPVDKGTERVTIIDVENHNDARGVRVEFSSYQFVVLVATQIEETNRHVVVF